MATETVSPLKLFYCYARQDQALRNELDTHLSILRRSGYIASWYDGEITPGTEWEKEISTKLDSSDVILLLVSSYFMKSDYCYNKEMMYALERHNTGKAHIIPILLRPVDWRNAPFSHLQVLPSNTRPVTRWSDRHAAFENIAQGIRKVVGQLQAKHMAAQQEKLIAEKLELDPPDVNTITYLIERLDLQQLIQLTKVLQEKWGVSPAPVVSTGPPSQQKTQFEIILSEAGPNKINAIKVVRECTGLGLKEAKAIVDKTPSLIKQNISQEEALRITNKMVEIGAKVIVTNGTSSRILTSRDYRRTLK